MTHIHSPLRAISITAVLWTAIILGGCSESEQEPPATDGFEEQIAEYIQRFPYQDTYKYMMAYTGGDASKLNTWVIGSEQNGLAPWPWLNLWESTISTPLLCMAAVYLKPIWVWR